MRRCQNAVKVFGYKVACDPNFDEEEFILGAEYALGEVLRRKSAVSAANQVMSSKDESEVQGIEMSDLNDLRSSLSELVSYQMMSGLCIVETSEKEERQSVRIELERVLRGEIVDIQPDAASPIDRVLPYDPIGDPLCQSRDLNEEKVVQLGTAESELSRAETSIPVVSMDVKLETLSTHEINSEGGAFHKTILGSIILRLHRDANIRGGNLDPIPPWRLHSIVDATELANFGWKPMNHIT